MIAHHDSNISQYTKADNEKLHFGFQDSHSRGGDVDPHIKFTCPNNISLRPMDPVPKHFHEIPIHLGALRACPTRRSPKASQIASRPGSAGTSFWPRLMGNLGGYNGFCDI